MLLTPIVTRRKSQTHSKFITLFEPIREQRSLGNLNSKERQVHEVWTVSTARGRRGCHTSRSELVSWNFSQLYKAKCGLAWQFEINECSLTSEIFSIHLQWCSWGQDKRPPLLGAQACRRWSGASGGKLKASAFGLPSPMDKKYKALRRGSKQCHSQGSKNPCG